MSNESLEDKEMMTNLIASGINITNPKATNLITIGLSSDDEEQTMENSSISTIKHLMINKVTKVCKEDILPTMKQEGTTNMVRKDRITRIPYLHPNTRVDTLINLCINIILNKNN